MVHELDHQLDTRKTIYFLKNNVYYNITVERDLLDKDYCLPNKDSHYRDREELFLTIRRKKSIPVYSICASESKNTKGHHRVNYYFTISPFGYNSKGFLCFKGLKSFITYAKSKICTTKMSTFSNTIRWSSYSIHENLKDLFGKGIDRLVEIYDLVSFLESIPKYDADRIMSVIRRDYYKIMRKRN